MTHFLNHAKTLPYESIFRITKALLNSGKVLKTDSWMKYLWIGVNPANIISKFKFLRISYKYKIGT